MMCSHRALASARRTRRSNRASSTLPPVGHGSPGAGRTAPGRPPGL